MGSLEIAFHGVPILILVACIVWIARFNISQQKGERLTLKWRDMDPVRKTVASVIVAWMGFNLYLTIGDLLAFLNVLVLPLGSTYSIYRPILSLASSSTFVGLAFLFRIRFPRRPVVS